MRINQDVVPTLFGMGLLDTIRHALALPDALNEAPPFESPWASPNHLLPVQWPTGPHEVTRRYALAVPAVKRARDLIAGSIARCSMAAYRGEDQVPAADVRFLTRTDGPVGPFHRMLWTIDDLIFYGWSCWAVDRDADGKVRSADRIPYERWSISQGVVYYDGAPADADTVVLIPGLNEGILKLCGATIAHAAELNRVAARSARTPAPQVLLKQVDGPPMADDDIANLKRDYLAARQAEGGGVAYANRNIDVLEMGKADPSLLLDGRNAAVLDIARATGIPAAMLDAGIAGASGSMTYANADARNRELIDYALAPYMAAVASRLGLDDVVARGVRIEFDTTTLVDVASRDVSVPDDAEGNDDA